MSTRRFATMLLVFAVAELVLLGVVVFIGEPQRIGRPAPHFHLVYLVYLAVPFLVMTAAAVTPLRDALPRRKGTHA